jgi:hypothetical protein
MYEPDMTAHDIHTDSDTLMRSFGTQLAPGGFAVFTDLAKAENAYVHHTAVPAAVVTFATISPAFARGRFRDTTLADIVLNRSHMDRREAMTLAAVCGERISAEPDPGANDFIAHLLAVIDRHGLAAFFGRYPDHPAAFGIDVRPHAVDWGSHDTDEAGLKAWREAYKTLDLSPQMLVASILWLYLGRHDSQWLRRLPHRWHAADAVSVMKASGVLGDWGKLVALYQGW